MTILQTNSGHLMLSFFSFLVRIIEKNNTTTNLFCIKSVTGIRIRQCSGWIATTRTHR